MTTPAAGDALQVRPAGLPPSDIAHRPFLIASLTMATLIGFVLGIHVPLGRLLDAGSPDRTTDLLHAHGQVQLLGFAGLFVIGMSLRLMPRFAGSTIALPSLVPVMLWLFVAGLLLRAVVLPWTSGDARGVLLAVSTLLVLCASGCFLLIAVAALGVDARRFDASSLAFIFGATLLFASSIIAAFGAIDAADEGARSLPYLTNNAVLQLQLFGFLISFILGVALRAIPSMVGLPRPGRSAVWLAVALAAAVTVLAGSLLSLEYLSYEKVTVVIADAAFLVLGCVLLALAWQAGALRQAANRLRPASQPHLWLVRSAFVWMVIAGIVTCYFGASSLNDAQLPSDLDFDAVRHTLGAGVVTMLITGMSLMILPEFAGDRLGANRQKQLAIGLAVLLNAAAVLRVAPALAGTRWSVDDRNLSMAAAGSLAEAALLVFTVYFFRLMWRARKGYGGTHGI